MRKLDVLGALTLVVGLSTASAAQQSVVWTGQSNIRVSGNAIQKTGGCDGCDDATAVSRQIIRSGNGSVEFRVDDPYTFWAAGLSRAGGAPRFNEIDFAWRFNGNGWADVIEDGAYQPNSDTEANEGDVFQVAVVNGRVQYMRNGSIVHESPRRPAYPLAFAVALGTIGTRLTDARMDTSGRDFVGTSGRSNPSSYEATDFTYMDRNRNGFLTRSEFDGDLREFNRMDLNRDGRVSRAEWAQAQRASSSFDSGFETGDYEAYVEARDQWTDTGVWVEAGDLITFAAAGTVNLNETGAVSEPSGSAYSTQNPPLRNAPVGVLIGRIGNSQPVQIGSRRTVRAPVSGELYLGVNDDVLTDNSGQYRVAISVQPR